MKSHLLFFALLISSIGYGQDYDSLSIEETLEYIDESSTNSSESNENPMVTLESLVTPTLVNPREVSQKNGYEKEVIKLQRFDHKKWKEIVGDNDYSELQSETKKKEQCKQARFIQKTNGKKK
jgi:hypothetical protein